MENEKKTSIFELLDFKDRMSYIAEIAAYNANKDEESKSVSDKIKETFL